MVRLHDEETAYTEMPARVQMCKSLVTTSYGDEDGTPYQTEKIFFLTCKMFINKAICFKLSTFHIPWIDQINLSQTGFLNSLFLKGVQKDHLMMWSPFKQHRLFLYYLFSPVLKAKYRFAQVEIWRFANFFFLYRL